MNRKITRRDFLNTMLLGSGAALLSMPAPLRLFAGTDTLDGFGGVGDYAGSNGETEEALRALNGVLGGKYDEAPAGVDDTGESYALAVVGGGLSGLSAAHHFNKVAPRGQQCILLDNHPVFGGQAKRNEFVVEGQRLMGPQASNSFGIVDRLGLVGYETYTELGIPQEFQYQALSPELRKLQFDTTNYGYKLWFDAPSIGYFFSDPSTDAGGRWVRDMWRRQLRKTPYSRKARRDLLRWRRDREDRSPGKDFHLWLDSMTYEHYVENVMGLSPEVTGFADPVMASTVGLGCDAISAYGAYQVYMPGFGRFRGHRSLRDSHWHSFPGGNDGISRYFVKALIPDSIAGGLSLNDIHNGRINFGALDRAGARVRMRLSATAVRVEHRSGPNGHAQVEVTYVKGGRAYRLRAGAVVMATGSWASRRVVRDLPRRLEKAFAGMHHSPMLVVNVALTNWRFLRRLGITACRWFGGFGFGCNIRRQMVIGEYDPPLDPDKPTVLTFYVPFYYPGHPVHEQGEMGRAELLGLSFRDYELVLRRQMARLFGMAGFDPENDIAGIILNRWTRGYVNPQPGFYFGTSEAPAPPDVVREGHGRVAFCHAELRGHQNWAGAAEEGLRAARSLL